MRDNRPGGWLGLIILVLLYIVGLALDIEWMRSVGGIGLVVWTVMLVVGFLSGARG